MVSDILSHITVCTSIPYLVATPDDSTSNRHRRVSEWEMYVSLPEPPWSTCNQPALAPLPCPTILAIEPPQLRRDISALHYDVPRCRTRLPPTAPSQGPKLHISYPTCQSGARAQEHHDCGTDVSRRANEFVHRQAVCRRLTLRLRSFIAIKPDGVQVSPPEKAGLLYTTDRVTAWPRWRDHRPFRAERVRPAPTLPDDPCLTILQLQARGNQARYPHEGAPGEAL